MRPEQRKLLFYFSFGLIMIKIKFLTHYNDLLLKCNSIEIKKFNFQAVIRVQLLNTISQLQKYFKRKQDIFYK